MDPQLVFLRQLVDKLTDQFRAAERGAHRNTDDLKGGFEILGTCQQAAKGAHRAETAHQVLGLDALFFHLPHDFGDGIDIAGCTDHAASAHRDIVGVNPLFFVFCYDFFGLLCQEGRGFLTLFRFRKIRIGRGVDKVYIGAHHPVQDQVARTVIRLRQVSTRIGFML